MAGTSKDKLIAELDEIVGWGAIAAPFIVLLAFSPLNLDFFGLPKLTALYLATLFLAYFQARRWFASGCIEIPIQSVLVPVGAVLLIATLAVGVSANPIASILGRFNRYESLIALFCYATILWFSLRSAQGEEPYERRFNLLFVLGFSAIAIYGLLEVFGLDMMSPRAKPNERISSTFGNPVFFGGFLAMSLPILLAKALSASQESKEIWNSSIVTLGLFCLGMAMLFSTQSRGAWLGAIVAFMVVIYFNFSHGWKPSLRTASLILLLLAGIALGILLSASSVGADTSRLFDAIKSTTSIENRTEIWKSSLRMISDGPLFGYGIDQTKDWFSAYITARLAHLENALHDRAHNIYLQMLIDGGAFFLLAQLWLVIYVLIKGIRSIKQNGNYLTIGFVAAISGYLVQGLTGIATIELSAFYWFILGSIIAISFGDEIKSIKFHVGLGPILERASTIALVPLVALILLPLVVEAKYISLSREARTTKSDFVLQKAYDAAGYCAMQPYYQWHLARLCLDFAQEKEDISYAELAVSAAKRGLRYAPDSPELIYILGSSYLTVAQYSADKGDLSLAEAQLGFARSKAPTFLGVHEDYLELYMQKGDYGKAVEKANYILRSIDDKNATAYVALSVAYEVKGRGDEAREFLKKASEIDSGAEEQRRRMIRLVE